MLRYPIGIQDFATLREGNYVYVDKTQHIERLVNSGKNYFLSRPRRFGKSLFINTLKYFFEGRKELFKGLYIEDKTNWERHPVIDLDFTTTDYTKDFYSSLCRLLEYNAKKYGIQLTSTIPLKEQFQELILSFDNFSDLSL